MKISGDETTNFIVVNQTADSLYSMIADEQYRATSLGRDTWKTVLGPHTPLQPNCNKEGFNAYTHRAKARIGILGNNEDDCNSCDSFIGLAQDGLTPQVHVQIQRLANSWDIFWFSDSRE